MVDPRTIRRSNDTVASVLARAGSTRPDAPFLVTLSDAGIRTVSYAAMHARAENAARLLTELGLRAGDRIHLHLRNCPDFYDLWFGAARAGIVIVPTNPLSTADELRYVIEHADCRISIAEHDLIATVEDAVRGRSHQIFSRGGPTQASGLQDIREAIDRATTRPLPLLPSPVDPLGVLYTSGTTSRPKGVVVTHAAYARVGEVVAEHLRLRPEDRQLIVLPLFHGNAQYYSTMSALVTGASIALVERFSASRWSAQAEQLGATVASLFAAPIRMILAQPSSPSDRRHRLRVVMFAQNVTPEQLVEFETRFGCPLIQLYGMTETVVPPTMNPLFGERRNMSIGRPVLSATVRIVDPEGVDVPIGEVGELLVAGEPGWTMMAGYLNDPEATATTIRDGWLHTGDSVRADADGYLWFVDRRKDLIKRAGENVSTGEVERVLETHPAVFEAAVIGVPDPIRDEAVKAFVVLRQGATCTSDELIAWCAARLASFKVPSEVEFIDALPRTSVGKVQKHLLRQRTDASPDHVGGAVRPTVEERG